MTVVTGGARQASAVSVSLTTAEPSGTSEVTLAGTLQGDRLTLALDEGGTPVTVEFRRVTQPLAFEEWTFADDGSGRRVRAAAVRDGGSIVGGGFVGVDGCAFAGCAGDVTAWDASGALRSVVTSSGGDCSTTATFSGSWDGSARVLSGPFSVGLELHRDRDRHVHRAEGGRRDERRGRRRARGDGPPRRRNRGGVRVRGGRVPVHVPARGEDPGGLAEAARAALRGVRRARGDGRVDPACGRDAGRRGGAGGADEAVGRVAPRRDGRAGGGGRATGRAGSHRGGRR